MDLAWCLVCEKKLVSESSLYCSSQCQLVDFQLPPTPLAPISGNDNTTANPPSPLRIQLSASEDEQKVHLLSSSSNRMKSIPSPSSQSQPPAIPNVGLHGNRTPFHHHHHHHDHHHHDAHPSSQSLGDKRRETGGGAHGLLPYNLHPPPSTQHHNHHESTRAHSSFHSHPVHPPSHRLSSAPGAGNVLRKPPSFGFPRGPSSEARRRHTIHIAAIHPPKSATSLGEMNSSHQGSGTLQSSPSRLPRPVSRPGPPPLRVTTLTTNTTTTTSPASKTTTTTTITPTTVFEVQPLPSPSPGQQQQQGSTTSPRLTFFQNRVVVVKTPTDDVQTLIPSVTSVMPPPPSEALSSSFLSRGGPAVVVPSPSHSSSATSLSGLWGRGSVLSLIPRSSSSTSLRVVSPGSWARHSSPVPVRTSTGTSSTPVQDSNSSSTLSISGRPQGSSSTEGTTFGHQSFPPLLKQVKLRTSWLLGV